MKNTDGGIFKQYQRKPMDIEAAQVAEHTAATIALWCGGSWGHERDQGTDKYLEIIVPNVSGNLKAHVNDYVVRKENGRFYVMTEAELLQEEYEEVKAATRENVKQERPAPPQALTPHYAMRGKHPFGN